MEPTKVMQCDCKHDFQDALYGKGMRLHNVSQGGSGKDKVAYCTVCCPRQQINKTATPPMPMAGVLKLWPADPPRKPKNIK